jgi:peptidoglycan/LPS O-acetylase OafA/YrhL
MLLGVLFHAGLSYVVLSIGWTVHDRYASRVFDVGCWLIHGFHLHLFFILSGFFARLSWYRHGTRGFVVSRARRVLVPFLIVWPPTFAATILVLYRAALTGAYVRPHPALGVPQTIALPEALSPLHLWYLYYLLIFYAGVVLTRSFHRRASDAPMRRLPTALLGSWVALLVLAVPSAWSLLAMRLLTVDTPYTFVPVPRILLAYAPFFAFGWLMERDRTIAARLARDAWRRLAFAVALAPPALFLAAHLDPETLRPPAQWRGLAEYATALFTWTTCTALIGLCSRDFSPPRPVIRRVADASYWIYLVHLPLVAALQLATANLGWPAPFKCMLLVVTPTLTLGFASYRGWVRRLLG